MIYLDNAATTFPKSEEVYRAVDKVMRTQCVNAGRGGYRLAREATEIVDQAREALLRLLELPNSRQVIFAPSATVALNQIIFGLEWSSLKNIYVSPFEHNAIMRPLNKICKMYNIDIHVIPFDKDTWKLNHSKLAQMFAMNNPDYIFVSHLSNVTGYILPVDDIREIANAYSPVFIVDCSQSLGSVSLSPAVLEAEYIVFAGHKSFYGPFGVGGFIAKNPNQLQAVIVGGNGADSLNLEMPETGSGKYESASYNIPAIAGLKTAIEWIAANQESIIGRKKFLTTLLVEGLKSIEGITCYLPSDLNSHANIVSINVENYNPEEIGMILDEDYEIAVRTGYHCSPLVHEFLGTKEVRGTLRVSIGYFTTDKEINDFIVALSEIIGG